ncbi:MAG: glutathione S-transferase [Hyphomonadaceae bacterium]|nr:MAG: glutathione S-transferase [Caulobacteraceae bacterium]MBT9445918.1 glutathione S-transferase [Hyphomonadaceae bacterium]TPW08584.1 MAG: glutathione S-transferase [Alphaproteobacteria bacterium]
MTIKVHHLNESRSQRILWMLEELALKYEIVPYQRDPVTRLAPPELKNIHPLGKSPVIEDVVDGNSRVVAESGAILDYLARWHGGGKFSFAPDDPQWPDYLHWMHYAEGSAMLPLMLNLYTARLGDAAAPLMPRITSEIDNHLGYVNGAIAGKEFIVGDKFTAADVQMSFVVEVGRAFGKLAAFPALDDYINRMHARPAYKRGVERGGPYAMGG